MPGRVASRSFRPRLGITVVGLLAIDHLFHGGQSLMRRERIETERLVLRKPVLEDADEIFARYANDREVTKFLGWARHESLEDTRTFLTLSDSEWMRWPAGPYLIEARAGGRLVGSTGLAFESADVAATGYVLARDAWGLGYATEALWAMVQLAKELGVRRLYALCHEDHLASARVLEKCGFTREGERQVAFPNLGDGGMERGYCFGRNFSGDGSSLDVGT